MLLHVDPGDDLAIYDQIVRQIKFAVAAEVLRPGELIPSVRETARSLAINPNTVARAYRELQGAGILQSVRGTGLAVAPEAVQRCRTDRLDLIRRRIRQTLSEAQRSRLETTELRRIVEEELSRLEQGGAA